ncbi:MAG: amidase family protein, partial [Anaerolineae bacterium]
MHLYDLTIHEARALLDAGEISAVELTQAVIDRILAVDNDVRAYITLTPEVALEQARAADAMVGAGLAPAPSAPAPGQGRGQAPPLRGIPIAIKDIICTAGIP